MSTVKFGADDIVDEDGVMDHGHVTVWGHLGQQNHVREQQNVQLGPQLLLDLEQFAGIDQMT